MATADWRLPTADCVRKIAIFRALFLGDLICSVPAFRALRQRFPEAEITLIGLPWAEAFVQRMQRYVDRFVTFGGYPGIREVEASPERKAALLEEQRAYGYDIAIQMHGSGAVSNGFVGALGARLSLGYGPAGEQRLTICLLHRADEHEVLRWLRLVGELGAPTDDCRLEWPISADEAARGAALLKDIADGSGPLIGMHTGSNDPARRWPPEKFAVLADRLAAQCGARILLTGSASERPITSAVQKAMRAPALDLAGQTDLGTFAAVIAGLDLLVTNDTGASHMAAATGTPSVVLFGTNRPVEWAPLDRQRHRPVDAHVFIEAGTDPVLALQQLPVEPVLDVCLDMLRNIGNQELKEPVEREVYESRV